MQFNAVETPTSSDISVTDGTHTLAGVTSVAFTGATVGGTAPNAIVTVPTPETSVSVTDGTHSLTGITNVEFTGAVVGGTAPNATVTVPTANVSVTDGTHSLSGITSVAFTGATVGGTAPNAIVTVPAPSVSVTDGTHALTGVTSVAFSGATVGGSAPNATVTVPAASVSVTDGTHALSGVTNVAFSGATVSGSAPNATVTLPVPSVSVTDGTSTVAGVTSLAFSGATVSGTAPHATITVSGGGGSSISSGQVIGGTSADYSLTTSFGLIAPIGTGLAANLALALQLTEGTGTTVNDSSGNGLTGTLHNGASWVTDGGESAVYLNGPGVGSAPQYIGVPNGYANILSGQENYSVFARVDIIAIQGQLIWSADQTSGSYCYITNDGTVMFRGNGTTLSSPSGTIVAGQTYNILCVANGSAGMLYINGISYSGVIGTPAIPAGGGLNIGAYDSLTSVSPVDWTVQQPNQKVHTVQAWTRSLSSGEAATLASSAYAVFDALSGAPLTFSLAAGTYQLSSVLDIDGAYAGDDIRAHLYNLTDSVVVANSERRMTSPASGVHQQLVLSNLLTITSTKTIQVRATNVDGDRGFVTGQDSSLSYIKIA